MILLLVPVFCVMAGLALYVALRATGAFGMLGGEGQRSDSATSWSSGSASPSTLKERVQAVPPGCLLAIAVTAALWIIGWLVVLVVGLSILA